MSSEPTTERARNPALPREERVTTSTKSNSLPRMSQPNSTTTSTESFSTPMKVSDKTSSNKKLSTSIVTPRLQEELTPLSTPSPDSTHGLMPLLREETDTTSSR